MILSLAEQQVINLCKNKGKVTNKAVQNLLGIHRNTATLKLKKMVSRGLLIKNGNGKDSFYILNNRSILTNPK